MFLFSKYRSWDFGEISLMVGTMYILAIFFNTYDAIFSPLICSFWILVCLLVGPQVSCQLLVGLLFGP